MVTTLPRSQPTTLTRKLKNGAKRGLRNLFRNRATVRRRHPSSPFLLRNSGDSVAAARRRLEIPRSMTAVFGADASSQFEFVEQCCPIDVVERLRRSEIHRDACTANGEPGVRPGRCGLP